MLRALELLLTGKTISDPEDYFQSSFDEENAIIMEIVLTDLSDWHREQAAIRPYLQGEEMRYQKRYWIDESQKTHAQSEYSWYGQSLTDEVDSVSKHSDFPDDISSLRQEIEEAAGKRFSTPTKEFKQKLFDLICEREDLKEHLKTGWIINPEGRKSMLDTLLPKFVLIPAVEDASDTANAKSQKKTVFKELLGLIVEKRLLNEPAVIALQTKISNVQKLMRSESGESIASFSEVENSLSWIQLASATFGLMPYST